MLQIISGGGNSKIPLSFASAPKIYKEEIGESVLLLCKVNNLGKISNKCSKNCFHGYIERTEEEGKYENICFDV